MLYRDCQGCFTRLHYSQINFVKPYKDGKHIMPSQWLCDVCLGKFLESYYEFRRFEKWQKRKLK